MRRPRTQDGRLLFLRDGTLLAQRSMRGALPRGRSDPSCRTGRELSPFGLFPYRQAASWPTVLDERRVGFRSSAGLTAGQTVGPRRTAGLFILDFCIVARWKRLAASKIDQRAGGEPGIWLDLLQG